MKLSTHTFQHRHIGPDDASVQVMLQAIGCKTLDELIEKTVPADIRLKQELKVGEGMTEHGYLDHLRKLGDHNQVMRSYIGMGYYGTIVPPVIQRNVLENPGWYTAYTPYQAEIAQGRLEGLLNFQTMVMDLTAMPIANASLLDEATAAAEAMTMLHASKEKEKKDAHVFLVSDQVYPQTLDVVITRAEPLGIEVRVVKDDALADHLSEDVYGVLLQYPRKDGKANAYASMCDKAHAAHIHVAVATDLLALTLLTPPGEWGADVVVGNSQRFGVPMGYGGPHAAFFACKESYKRNIPGRIIGVSVDRLGHSALRMALQTREQHIKRERATSNICTAQALLAIMASMYGVYHGPKGLKEIAQWVHGSALRFREVCKKLGYTVSEGEIFDTVQVQVDDAVRKSLQKNALANHINLNYTVAGCIQVSMDETVTESDLQVLCDVFAQTAGKDSIAVQSADLLKIGGEVSGGVARTSSFMEHPIFNRHHSESEMMRYIKMLENKDLSLVHSMISLGSCTMKLNAAAELLPLTWPAFANIHPFVPAEQAKGYHEIIEALNKDLCDITGFAAMSFQPNSGAQGEYAGLMVIRAYHMANGDNHRNIALIPSSAHGTNPASAALAGMQIVVVKCDERGNIDVNDLKEKAVKHKDALSCLMVTYPSTHGVFEASIREITQIIHDNGGQVYMDGANMNAQVGLTSPGNIGADVCHLNLHKTFAIPHGGGGPGMGPIGVAAHLVPFLPGHVLNEEQSSKAIHAVSAAHYGSALILLISYGYIKMLGSRGLKDATRFAILNANYIKSRLQDHYPILYTGENGTCAHELILDCRELKKRSGVEVADIAKRLIDYGFHAPTVAFPVVDTLMVEPTESEPKEELDRFCDAMIQIRQEIESIATGSADKADNLLKNAPHTAEEVTATHWQHGYSREEAAYPLTYIRMAKFWPSVARVDNAHGDRNLICSCLPLEAYLTEETAVQ